jgi:predicted  nucleic acid-binding Zn-ribbon protein
MLGKLYAALKSADTPDREAQEAAEEVGDLHEQLGGLQTAVQTMHADLKNEFGAMRTEFKEGLSGLRSEFKAELSGLRSEFKEELSGLRSESREGLSGLRSEFKEELSGLRSESRKASSDLRSEIAYLRGRFDVLIWAVGINAAATIAILGVLLRR